MKWHEYENNFIRRAKLSGKDENYCIYQLEYAKKIFDANLPIIYNQVHLCKLVGYKEEYVYAASNGGHRFYRRFYIDKKNGKKRTIDEPLPSLKEIQNWILHEILYRVQISPYAKGYVPGKSIKDNARFHKGQNMVLSMDLKDFFPSIKYGRVLSLFRKLGYREPVAVMLANLCCLDGCIPQGAPTSPFLSNIIACQLDDDIEEYVKQKKIRYTRYADDLTFSGKFNEGDVIKNIERITKKWGFLINEEKTRVRKRNQRQEVTGIVVNEKLQVKRKLRRKLRCEIYYIKKYGLKSHLEHIDCRKSNYLYHLMGLVSYASFINPYDKELYKYLDFLKELLKIET